jgi:ribA/ribD-fused uncharacterized protein
MNEEIAFTKVNLPYGWLGNMSPYPVEYKGKHYRTTEALFQCMRFDGYPEVQESIMAQKSPMSAKMSAKKFRKDLGLEVNMGDEADLERMRICLRLKINQHHNLKEMLLFTGDAMIIEDSSKRLNVSGLFWGSAKIVGEWVGRNKLGILWMDLREELKEEIKKAA